MGEVVLSRDIVFRKEAFDSAVACVERYIKRERAEWRKQRIIELKQELQDLETEEKEKGNKE